MNGKLTPITACALSGSVLLTTVRAGRFLPGEWRYLAACARLREQRESVLRQQPSGEGSDQGSCRGRTPRSTSARWCPAGTDQRAVSPERRTRSADAAHHRRWAWRRGRRRADMTGAQRSSCAAAADCSSAAQHHLIRNGSTHTSSTVTVRANSSAPAALVSRPTASRRSSRSSTSKPPKSFNGTAVFSLRRPGLSLDVSMSQHSWHTNQTVNINAIDWRGVPAGIRRRSQPARRQRRPFRRTCARMGIRTINQQWDCGWRTYHSIQWSFSFFFSNSLSFVQRHVALYDHQNAGARLQHAADGRIRCAPTRRTPCPHRGERSCSHHEETCPLGTAC